MDLTYLLLLGFLFYVSLGVFLIFKNNSISASSRYLGLFFISLSFSPLSLFLYRMNFYDLFIVTFLLVQTHMFWFYFYINAVIGNKISKFNFYFSSSFFILIFILNIYTFFEISQSDIISSQKEILYPFQIVDDGQFSFITKFNYLFRLLISFLISFYTLIILKKFKEKGIDNKSKMDLYIWLINIVIFLLIFSAARIAFLIISKYVAIDLSSVNAYFFIFPQLLLLVFVSQIFKYPLISLGIPISNRMYKPKENAIDQSSRTYLFDSPIMEQKILEWENNSDSYLNKNFNLSQFSKEIHIDELELLYYLNEFKEISFEDYLKFLRISFVLKKIESKYLDDHSISDLASISGFKNGKNLEKEFEKVLKSNISDYIEL
jgi:hypothetical protein